MKAAGDTEGAIRLTKPGKCRARIMKKKGARMNRFLELVKAKKEASNIENLSWWKSKMPDLIPLGCDYVNGEPRRFYKEKSRDVYWYRVIAECEMHRWA